MILWKVQYFCFGFWNFMKHFLLLTEKWRVNVHIILTTLMYTLFFICKSKSEMKV